MKWNFHGQKIRWVLKDVIHTAAYLHTYLPYLKVGCLNHVTMGKSKDEIESY
jgi:hypothetical protein